MRRVIFEVSVSLDGFVLGREVNSDRMMDADDAIFDSESFLSRFDTIFFGRRAYERFAVPTFPVSAMNDTDRDHYYMLHRMRKYVFSKREKHVRGNGMVVGDSIESEVKRIRDEEGKNILLCSGEGLFSMFVRLDLIDELVLVIHPVVKAGGKRLFKRGSRPMRLELIDRKNLKSGVVVLHYRTVRTA